MYFPYKSIPLFFFFFFLSLVFFCFVLFSFPQQTMSLFSSNDRYQLFLGILVGVSVWLLLQTPPSPELKGKRVVVCGASTGIGEMIAYHYAERGADVILVARRQKQLEEVADRCRERGGGGKIHVLAVDLSTKEGCDFLTTESLRLFDGHVDTLLLNHIMGYYGNWLEFDEEKRYEYVDKIFRINTYSYFQLALSFLPHLNQTNGRIGVVSSLAGRMGCPKVAPYAATKHALNGFFDSLRQDIEMDGKSNVTITVHTIGNIDTPNARENTRGQLDNLKWHPPHEAAASIITSTELGQRENYYPYLETRITSILQPIFPEFVDAGIRFILSRQ